MMFSLHLVPGSSTNLDKLCLSGQNLLLVYVDGRVRLWDMQTTEFRRSTDADKAAELLGEGGWTQMYAMTACLRYIPTNAVFSALSETNDEQRLTALSNNMSTPDSGKIF